MPAVPRVSAGILPWRKGTDGLELFLAHMGGPFWAGREEGAWSIVKGELDAGRGAGGSRFAGVPRGDRL